METINFKKKLFVVVKKLNNNKLHVRYKDKDYVLVPFNSYMNFSNYLASKKVLKKNKVEMAKLIKKDKKSLLVLEEFIHGEIATNIIADDRFEKKHYEELFRVFRNNRFAKIALNYKPENFVYRKKYLYYIGTDVARYNQNTSFEKTDDILLWMSTKEAKQYCEEHNLVYKERYLYKEGGELNKQLALLCVTYW